MRPFDPRLVRLVPASRGPVLALAGIGVLQGTATIGVAFALTRPAVALGMVADSPETAGNLPLPVMFVPWPTGPGVRRLVRRCGGGARGPGRREPVG